MAKISAFLLAASVFLLLSGPAPAEGKVQPAPGVQEKSRVNSLPAELKAPAKAQAGADLAGCTDFDAITSANDPLYREGAKELLKRSTKNGADKKSAPAGTMRDAPVSKGAKSAAPKQAKPRGLFKKIGPGKPLQVDPVKVKNTF